MAESIDEMEAAFGLYRAAHEAGHLVLESGSFAEFLHDHLFQSLEIMRAASLDEYASLELRERAAVAYLQSLERSLGWFRHFVPEIEI